jgi:hypothetical protein
MCKSSKFRVERGGWRHTIILVKYAHEEADLKAPLALWQKISRESNIDTDEVVVRIIRAAVMPHTAFSTL